MYMPSTCGQGQSLCPYGENAPLAPIKASIRPSGRPVGALRRSESRHTATVMPHHNRHVAPAHRRAPFRSLNGGVGVGNRGEICSLLKIEHVIKYGEIVHSLCKINNKQWAILCFSYLCLLLF